MSQLIAMRASGELVMDERGRLRVGRGDAGMEIAVVYYRALYVPEHYQHDEEGIWDMREFLERSSAVLCPSVPSQLAGCKECQLSWTEDGVLERFGVGPEALAGLRGVFARQARGAGGGEIVQLALKSPHEWVLKPQREGGGSNQFGDAVRRILEDGDAARRYVLMERIRAPSTRIAIFNRTEEGVLAAPAKPVAIQAVTELGIYGVYLASGRSVLLNRATGHILRSKDRSVDEGTVSRGSAVLDSPALEEDEDRWAARLER
eukprot:Polyplicarium_translucidae@DN2859_c0_g1_i3.p1